MPGPHKGYTTPHKCATISDSKRNQPSDRDQQARCKLQEKASGFQIHLYTPRSTINRETTTGRDQTRR